MNRFDDGINEWREDMAHSTDWRDQRKANYQTPEERHEQALDFIERERKGAFEMIRRRACECVEENEIFNTAYEIESIRREVASLGYTAKEVRQMFKGSRHAQVISRELILMIPELADYCRIRKCSISEFYPELQWLEGSHAIDTEEGGDFAA